MFITCVSIVIVLHLLYRAAISALLSLVVLLIMLCEIACCTSVTVWANKEGRRREGTWPIFATFYTAVFEPHYCRFPNIITVPHCVNTAATSANFSAIARYHHPSCLSLFNLPRFQRPFPISQLRTRAFLLSVLTMIDDPNHQCRPEYRSADCIGPTATILHTYFPFNHQCCDLRSRDEIRRL